MPYYIADTNTGYENPELYDTCPEGYLTLDEWQVKYAPKTKTFYSPQGNPEVWAEKPKGYFTPEEWQAAHPAPEPEPLSDEELAAQVRMERDGKLQETDKYLIADFPIDADKLEAVKAYRTALRDITKQEGFPHNVTWPKNPMK